MSDAELANALKLLGAIAAFITVTLVPAAVAIINAWNNKRAADSAAQVIRIEQGNRELAAKGLDPVTNVSPPIGTGDGRIDKAVENMLPLGPATATAPPTSVPPPAP